MYIKEEYTDELRSYHTFKKLGGPKKVSDVVTNDLYKHYVANRLSEKKIDRTLANKIFFEFNANIAKQIVFFNFEFNFPGGLGLLRIEKRERPAVKVDEFGKVHKKYLYVINFNETKKLWEKDPEAKKNKKKIYIKYSDEYMYRWKWNKKGYVIKNKIAYRFTPSRANKKMVKAALDNEMYNIDYFK